MMRRIVITRFSASSRHLRPAPTSGLLSGRSRPWTQGVRWIGSTTTVHVEDVAPSWIPEPNTHTLRCISTLDPHKLTSADFLDISGLTWPSLGMPSGVFHAAVRYYHRLDSHQKQKILPFPPDTRGFLYYHISESLPPTAGEVRFRLTRDGGPEAFDIASDLLAPTGLPWSVPLWRIASLTTKKPIRNLLIEEKLVSEDVLVRCREFGLRGSTSNENVMHALGQLIPVSPGQHKMRLHVVSKGPAKVFRLQRLAITPPKEAADGHTPTDWHTPTDFLHVSIEHDPRRNRFACRVVAKYNTQSRTLVPLKGEPTEIRGTTTEDDPYEALCSLLDATSSLKMLEQRSLAYARPISTFDPHRLHPVDYVDLSSLINACTVVRGTSVSLYYCDSSRGRISRIPFPDDTRGFLYYHGPKNLPDGAGEIRFRKMPNDDPGMFSQGSDLLLPHGVPWSIPAWYLASRPAYTAVWESLVRDELVTRNLIENFAKTSSEWAKVKLRAPVIHALGQPFAVPIGKSKACPVWIADDQGPYPTSLLTPFANLFEKGEAAPTASNKWACAVVCIEHDGNNFVVRVLDIHEAYKGKIRTNVGDTHPLTFRARNSNPSIAYNKLLKMAEEQRR